MIISVQYSQAAVFSDIIYISHQNPLVRGVQMKINFVILLFALVSACHPRPSYDFVIRDVGLFDGEKDLGIVNIAINGDTIGAISKDPLNGDSMLEAKGKYLIPGLVNSHVHIWELEQLKEGYDAGVLAHMGMHASNRVRDSTIRAASANDGYPFYYSSGVAATVPGGHPTEITPNIETINDSISVRQFVDHRVSHGADYIKITKESTAWYAQPDGPPSLSYDSIAKLIEYSHERNKKAVVHIGSLVEMTTIARFKPDGFVHMWYSAYDADLTEKKLKIIKESGAFIVPTARVNERALALAENEGSLFAAWARENYPGRVT